MTIDRRDSTDGSLLACSFSPYRLLNAIACSRIHWRAFSRLLAAIKLEFDECSLVNEFDPGVPAPLLLLPWLSLTNEFECEEPLRPQRAGFNDAKNDDARELEPKRERDDDEPADELVLPPATAFGGVDNAFDDDGVFRPDEPVSRIQN